MLKKDRKSSQSLGTSRKPSVECSLCKSCSTRTAFYICDSGQIVCENCRRSDGSERRQDSGDCAPEKKRTNHTKKTKNIPPKSPCVTKDFASGDHDKRRKIPTKETKSQSECKFNMCMDHGEIKSTSANKTRTRDDMEMIIEYKNLNYKDDKSSTSTSRHDMELITELPMLPDNRVCPRWYQYFILKFTGPVQCPVEACNKIIALDAVMLHFYFDHSKVPRMTLSASSARRLYLKPGNLSTESQCLCIFLLQENKEVSISPKLSLGEVHSSDCKYLLLMGAKMQMEKLKHRDEKSFKSPISVRDICTQTEVLRSDITKKISKISVKKCESYRSIAQNEFDDNEILLLWLCKQDDNTDSYSISVLRKDKKQGFDYLGEAIYIRNKQSPAEMFHQADCLMVTGTALNKLLDEKSQLSVLVNVLE